MRFDDISEVAGPKNCWPGHRKIGTQPGTGKNAGQRVNKCKKIGEEINSADVGEYDREGDMAQSQLKTAEDAAAELRSILDADENLPEWVQSKITKAVDYLDTARDYMKAEKQGVAESSQRVDSLVTDALRIMKGAEVSDAVSALKTVLGDREYNGRRGHYNFYVRQIFDMYNQQGVAEGWKEEAQELEDWTKEVNMRLYRAHESQRLGLARQLSKLEQKHFGSEFTHPNLTNIVWSALRALQKGDMVHYDPQRVGQMPFGNIVGDDAKIIAQYNITREELAGYRMLHDKGMVDNLEQFLKLRRLVRAKSWPLEYFEELEKLTPEEAWLKMANDLNWSKDNMSEEVQAKTDDKLLAYYAQRKAEKKKKEQGMAKDNSALGQAVKEAGWGRRYASYHDELSSRERDEQNAMDQSKRDFKRAELQHELGHEDDPNFERNLRQQQIDRDRGPWYIRIDGKIYRQKGQPKSFDWKRGANNYALAMVKNNPSLQGKIMLSKSAEDK
jgi:hypothetical protein